MSSAYAQMIGALEHDAEAVRLGRYRGELCARLMKADGLEEPLNLTL